MSSSINSVWTGKPYPSLISSERQQESKNSQQSHKKKQIVSVREGKYYCTYIVDDKGQKILLNRVPVTQVEDRKNTEKHMDGDETKSCDYNAIDNSRTAFEGKQQMNIEVSHKKNLQEVMNIVKEYAGIANDSSKIVVAL